MVNSSSNLPTANNSFHTIISSPEQDKYGDEYINLAYSRSRKATIKTDNRKISTTESDMDSTDFSEMNSFGGNVLVNNLKKKSDDFKNKFKTEMCKFWELDAACKFGDNVKLL